jgi:hypothetical protein
MNVILGRIALSALLSLLLGATGLHAAPLTVNNFSFEAPVLGSGGWTNNLLDPALSTADPQWTGRSGNNFADTFIEYIGGFRSEGNQHVGMQNGYFIFQNLGIPFAANTTYRLTVGVGYRNAGQSGALSTSVIGLTVLDEPPSDANFLPGTNTDDQLAIDELLTASSTSVDSVALNNATQLTFTDVTTVYTTGATPPVGNIVVFLGDAADGVRSHFDNVRLEAVSALDPDGDGIPAEWETGTDRGVARNLDPAVNDGGLDFDGDTLTNFREFEIGTHPRLADTDADGLNDNLETTTDPLNPDGDGDTLLDGAEVTAGTNPNDPDSDDDNFEDQAEIASGTNPLVADSKPTNNGEILLGINFVGGNATSAGAEVTSEAGSLLQANWNNAPGGSGGPINIVSSAAAVSIMRVDWKTNGPAIVGVEPLAEDGNARLMHGMLRPRGTLAVPAGDDIITEITVRNIAYPTYDVYLYLNSEAGGQAIFTANDQSLTVSNILTYVDSFVQVPGDGGEGNVVHFPNLTGPTLTITQTIESGGIAGFQIVRATTDGDGDGMPNLWEDSNGLDKTNPADAALDADSDGSNNLQEFQRATNPRNPDSDGDGLRDGVETKTGIFVNATNTGTDPLKSDTDGDGLADTVETGTGTFVNADNAGTDPNKVDTDGDTFTDGDEVTLGGDPTLASSTPNLPPTIGYWPFNDQGTVETADASGNGNVGTVVGGLTYGPGQTGQAGDFAAQFNGTDAAVTTTSPLLSNREAYTMSGWVNFTEPQAARTGWFGQNDAVEFGMISATAIELWHPTGGAIGAAFGPSSNGWAHIAVVADATGRRIYINGALAASGSVGTPTADNTSTFNIGGAGVQDASGNFFNGQIDDVAIWDTALPLTFIERLANRSLSPGGAPPAQSDFAISTVTFNPATQQMTITFPTTPGRNYAVFKRDSTTNNQWFEIHDFVATTEVGNHNIPIPAGITPVLVRVEESQN